MRRGRFSVSATDIQVELIAANLVVVPLPLFC
jgi:hypothetical protein